jgi:hypothetical protein
MNVEVLGQTLKHYNAVGGKAANGADPANTCGQHHEGFTNGKCRFSCVLCACSIVMFLMGYIVLLWL